MFFFVCHAGVGHDLARMNVNVRRAVIPTLLLVHVTGVTLVSGPGRESNLPRLRDLTCTGHHRFDVEALGEDKLMLH